jgi:hypothetical protein
MSGWWGCTGGSDDCHVESPAMRRPSLVLIVVLAVGLLSAPAASASASQAIADCNAHGSLTRHYSTTDLRTALGTMPAPIREYTNCSDVINRQLLAQIGATHDNGAGVSKASSGGSFFSPALIAVLAALALAGAGFGVLALRRR